MPDEAELDPAHRLYWDAFFDLTHDRRTTQVVVPGLGVHSVPGRIPWSAVDDWARRWALDAHEFEILKHLLGALDTEYLAIEAERRGAAARKTES